jgi:hypothetical protein
MLEYVMIPVHSQTCMTYTYQVFVLFMCMYIYYFARGRIADEGVDVSLMSSLSFALNEACGHHMSNVEA